MSIKRFTPVQDTFIVNGSIGSTLNVGQDSILELGKCSREGTSGSSRILIKFNSNDINFIKTLGSIPCSASLVMYFSEAKRLPSEYVVEGTSIKADWREGFGHLCDIPPYTEGATWNYGISEEIPWETPNVTEIIEKCDGGYADLDSIDNRFDGKYAATGSFTGHLNGGYASGSEGIYYFSQQFTKQSSKDICMDITPVVQSWANGFETNNGIVLRLQDESLAETFGTRISFFSSDTHTIYKPYIEFGWDDSIYEPEDKPVFNINSSSVFVLDNLQSSYFTDDVVELNLIISSLYPTRIFTTSSLYFQNEYVLPEGTCWGVKNEYTNEMVIDFNSSFTKVSVSGSRNYFNLDMSSLEPERYYRLLFSVPNINGFRTIVDNRNIFKVIRHGK